MEASKQWDLQTLLVWGYIRAIERALININIPVEINDIIYLYQRLYDEWCQEYKHSDVSIGTDTSIISIDTDKDMTIYGKEVVEEGVFKWRIKIISFTNSYSKTYYPFIGIVINDKDHLNGYLDDVDFDDIGYQFCAGVGKLYSVSDINFNDHQEHEEQAQEKCIWKKNGDILDLILDLDNGTINCRVKGSDFVEIFTNVKSDKYRLALGVSRCKGSQFQLL